MEKEKVLEIESQEVFDKVAVRIKYQNEEILPRGEFKDKKLGIYSKDYFRINISDDIYIRGNEKELDDRVIILSKNEFNDLEERIEKLNEKYGIAKRWRAKELEEYYFIGSSGIIWSVGEEFSGEDNDHYNLGNYFQTEEQAQKVIDSTEWQDFWAKVRAGETGND